MKTLMIRKQAYSLAFLDKVKLKHYINNTPYTPLDTPIFLLELNPSLLFTPPYSNNIATTSKHNNIVVMHQNDTINTIMPENTFLVDFKYFMNNVKELQSVYVHKSTTNINVLLPKLFKYIVISDFLNSTSLSSCFIADSTVSFDKSIIPITIPRLTNISNCLFKLDNNDNTNNTSFFSYWTKTSLSAFTQFIIDFYKSVRLNKNEFFRNTSEINEFTLIEH